MLEIQRLQQLLQPLSQPPRNAQEAENQIKLCKQGLEILSRMDNPLLQAVMQSDIGNLLNRLALMTYKDRGEKIELSINTCKDALNSMDRIQNFPPDMVQARSGTMNNLGNAYVARIYGDRAENIELAIKWFEDALRITSPQNMPAEWARIMNNRGLAYSNRIKGNRADNIEKAIKDFGNALLIRKRITLPVEWAATMMNLAIAYKDRIYGDKADNIEQSIMACKNSLQVRTFQTMPKEWSQAVMNLAVAFQERIRGNPSDNIEQSISLYHQALKVRTKDTMPFEWSKIMNNLGNIFLVRVVGNHKENIKQAIYYFKQALEIMTLDLFPAERRQIQRNLGKIFFNEQQWSEALASFQDAMEAGKRRLNDSFTEAGRKFEVNETTRFSARAAYCLWQLGQPATSLHQLEQGKTQLMAEALSLGNVNLSRLPAKQQQNLRQIQQQIALLEAEIRLQHDTPARRSDRDLAELLQQAHNELRLQLAIIEQTYPDFLPTGLDVSVILALIPVDGVLIAPFITSQGGAVFVVPHDSETVTNEHIIPLPALTTDYLSELLLGVKDASTLGGWFGAYDHFRRNEGSHADDNWFQQIKDATSKLWNTLVGLIYERLQTLNLSPGAPVLLMPQGGLGLLPLHAAWRQVDGQLRYFCDDYTITYAPSAYALHISRQRATQPERQARSLFAANNPTRDLKYTPLEGEAIAQLFPSAKQTILYEAKATTAAFPPAAKGHTYIHYSGHGTYNWRDPLQSGLQLADKAYTLSDILSGLDLSSCRLVTLSACETGITEFQQSPDEYVGLPAGFLQAGATAVISTLWAVNDLSTMLLMEKFYQLHLQDVLDFASALRQAQLWLRNVTAKELADRFGEERMKLKGSRLTLAEASDYWRRFAANEPDSKPFAHPYYWAAFTFTGA